MGVPVISSVARNNSNNPSCAYENRAEKMRRRLRKKLHQRFIEAGCESIEEIPADVRETPSIKVEGIINCENGQIRAVKVGGRIMAVGVGGVPLEELLRLIASKPEVFK